MFQRLLYSHITYIVLTWVSIYWFSRAGPAASVRIYYETVQGGDRDRVLEVPRHVPMGASYFPMELRQLPSRCAQFLILFLFPSVS